MEKVRTHLGAGPNENHPEPGAEVLCGREGAWGPYRGAKAPPSFTQFWKGTHLCCPNLTPTPPFREWRQGDVTHSQPETLFWTFWFPLPPLRKPCSGHSHWAARVYVQLWLNDKVSNNPGYSLHYRKWSLEPLSNIIPISPTMLTAFVFRYCYLELHVCMFYLKDMG